VSGRCSGLSSRHPLFSAGGIAAAVAAMIAVLVFGVAGAADARASHSGVSIGSMMYRAYGEPQLVTWHQFELLTFSRDTRRSSRCVGQCSRSWVPVITSGPPHAKTASQIRSRHLGTVRRPNGQLQVTYYGHPLYRPRGKKQEAAMSCTGSIKRFGGTVSLINGRRRPNRAVRAVLTAAVPNRIPAALRQLASAR
jgi:predicted lipoprotein with Yx(FWY)xxD motif